MSSSSSTLFVQSCMGRMSRCSSRAKRTKPALCKRQGLTASPPWFQIEHEEQVDKIMVSTRLKNIGQIGYFPLIWGWKLKPNWNYLVEVCWKLLKVIGKDKKKHAPNWWWKMVMNPVVESIKSHQTKKSKMKSGSGLLKTNSGEIPGEKKKHNWRNWICFYHPTWIWMWKGREFPGPNYCQG